MNAWRYTFYIAELSRINIINKQRFKCNNQKTEFKIRDRFHEETCTEELCKLIAQRPPVYVYEWINYLNIILNFYDIHWGIIKLITRLTSDLYEYIQCNEKQQKSTNREFSEFMYDEPLNKHHYLKDDENFKDIRAYEQLETLRLWNFQLFMKNVPRRSRA